MRPVYFLVILTLITNRPAAAALSSTMIEEMREITSVSVSPSGQLAVVGICHSNPRTDKRETSWVIVPLRGDGTLKTVSAGEEIYEPNASGALLSRQALWSRDGKWFFYLRRNGEEVQLWETRSDGRVTRQVTHSASDLIDLKRSSDPDEFIVQLAPDRAVLRKAEEDEDRSGILYDDRIIGRFPLTKALPIIDRWRNIKMADNGEWLPPGWTGRTSAVFDVRRRALKSAAEPIPTAFDASETGSKRVSVMALEPMPKDPYNYGGKFTLQLEFETEEKHALKCEIAECIANRIAVIGWSPNGAEIYYLADSLGGALGSGFPGGASIYAWNPRDNVVRLIYDSGRDGLWGRLYNLDAVAQLSLEPGPFAGRELVAAFAGADQPPLLEAINLDTGFRRILFDPNAELRSLTRGRAVWHTWETSTGYSGRGMVVLPDDYRSGEKYPAVINTYSCGNGLLRGGSGDGAPEFVLAHEGFIGICVDVRGREIMAREADLTRMYPIFCDIVAALIADLTKDGKLDPARVGLTGHSFGANAGAYCISHSSVIAAAALQHPGAVERAVWDLFDTGARIRGPNGFYAKWHLPDPRNDPTGRWDAMSVSHRAREINAPTLIQIDDLEYLTALPLWSAMREEGKAIEMHVFPKDTHFLMQPIHRLVNYERQLDWFKFWLKREEDSAPSKHDQYDRWRRLREAARDSSPPR